MSWSEKNELWTRWRRGEPLRDIAHALVIGFNHGRLAAWGSRKRELRVTDEGISVPGRFFTRLTLPWAELAEITIGPDKARVIATDGRDQPIELSDAFGAAAIRAALLEAQARHGAYRAALPASTSSPYIPR